MIVLLLAFSAPAAPWPDGRDHPNPWTATPTGLEVQDLVVGTGLEAEAGALASVHYTGLLADGTVFDANAPTDEPFAFRLGGGQVIPGWDEGVLGMRVGGTRRLAIPAALAYGPRAVGPIPADSALFFEVELVAVEAPRRAPAAPETVADEAWKVLDAGVRWADVVTGDGGRARDGHRLCVDTATWTGGQLTADTYGRTRCTWLRLGEGDLPRTVELAMLRMRAGGVRIVEVADGTVWRIALANVGD